MGEEVKRPPLSAEALVVTAERTQKRPIHDQEEAQKFLATVASPKRPLYLQIYRNSDESLDPSILFVFMWMGWGSLTFLVGDVSWSSQSLSPPPFEEELVAFPDDFSIRADTFVPYEVVLEVCKEYLSGGSMNPPEILEWEQLTW